MGMESVAEFWTKVDADKGLQEEFFSAVKNADAEQVVAFAKEHDFDFTVDDLRKLAEVAEKPELTDADLDNVVGGASFGSFSFGETSKFALSRLNKSFISPSAYPAPM